jgi:trigger factor
MSSTLEKLEKNHVSLELTISPESIEEALGKAYLKVVQKVSLPGFRKGKIPRRILEANFGRGVLYEDAIDILVPEAYEAALKEHHLEPIDQPKFDIVKQFEEGSPFVIKATVEVVPEVTLGEYKGLKVEKTVPVVTDEQVEERLKALQDRHSELVAVDRKILEKGDFAIVDFEGYMDGKPFPGGAGQGQTLEIGGGTFIPGFEEALIGMETETEREISVTFPEDYRATELAGKPATFKVTLRDIKVKELPELDDEFAKALGAESMEKLKEDFKTRMQEAAEHQNEQAWEEAVIGKAVDNAQVEVPQTLVEREIDQVIHEFEHNLAYQGLNMEQYMTLAGKSEDDIRSEFKPSAEKRAKTDLVLEAIGTAEHLDASEEEIKAKITELIQSYPPKDRAKAEKELKKPSRTEGLNRALVMEKTVKFLTQNAVSAAE